MGEEREGGDSVGSSFFATFYFVNKQDAGDGGSGLLPRVAVFFFSHILDAAPFG